MQLHTALWFAWAFACALGVRVGFTRLLRPRLGGTARVASYGMWLVLLLLGSVLVGLSGMQMYGFDPGDPGQMWGYWLFFYSPLGLPTLFGAPAVLAVDLMRAATKWFRRRLAA
jgi:hypothetical protein